LGGLPGMILTCLFFGAGLAPLLQIVLLTLPVPLSLWAFFPPIITSMLAEDSILAPYSSQVARSFRAGGEGWMFFYCYSLALLLPASGGLSLAISANVSLAAAGAVVLVTTGLIYFRLLG